MTDHSRESVEAMADELESVFPIPGKEKLIRGDAPDMLRDLQVRIEELKAVVNRLVQADDDQSLDSDDIEFARKSIAASPTPPVPAAHVHDTLRSICKSPRHKGPLISAANARSWELSEALKQFSSTTPPASEDGK